MSTAGVGGQARNLVDLVVLGLRAGGFAHVRGAHIALLQSGGDALLFGQRLAQGLAAVVDAPRL